MKDDQEKKIKYYEHKVNNILDEREWVLTVYERKVCFKNKAWFDKRWAEGFE
jgi:hypothetical protein